MPNEPTTTGTTHPAHPASSVRPGCDDSGRGDGVHARVDDHLLGHITMRHLLIAAGTGALLAASFTVLGQSDADAAESSLNPPTVAATVATVAATAAAEGSSSAYGVAATGADPVSPTPSVSTSGAVKSASGSASSPAGTFTASGLKVRAGDGIAESSIAALTVAGETFGPVTASCRDGVTEISHNGKTAKADNLTVAYGVGGGAQTVGITVTIDGAGDQQAQIITGAAASCGKGTPPEDDPGKNPDKPDHPGDDSGNGNGNAGDSAESDPVPGGSGTRTPGPAPRPSLRTGHHPVTG